MTVAHTPPRRLAYLGTPAIAVPPLHALVEAGFDIEIVVTNEDARRGRGKELSPTPVKAAALELGLPVSHRVADVLDTTAELGVVVAFGHLIPTSVLDRMPMVNIHYSLLPRWRGAAPLERAILAGDDVTGVCLMEVAEALDAGGVFAQAEVPIGPDDTLDELRAALVEASLPLLIDNLKAGLGEAVPQDGEITWAKKFDPADFDIDFTRPAHEVHGLVRLGRAFTRFRGKRLAIRRTALLDTPPELDPEPSDDLPDVPGSVVADTVLAGDGRWLQLIEVQPEGRKRVAGDAWANGARLEKNERFGRGQTP